MAGPKLGVFFVETHQSDPGTTGAVVSGSVDGLLAGLNAGVFASVGSRASLGLLLSFDMLWAEHACLTFSGVGTQCSDVTTTETGKVVGLTAAALF